MERPEANYSLSMQNRSFGMTSSRGGSGFDRQAYTPFQAIIEKGRQAKAQDEHDQYEARKLKRETDIKNAARIRHAEAEANRRRAEESKVSIDDHKGRLLDEMTKNIKAVLENQYREEIREKVYEDEDKIISAYEHDVKDQTKVRLVNELESVVKAKLGADFEPKIKQQLAVELESVVKEELRARYATEIKQQLVKELGPEIEAELRAKYGTEVKQQLVEELQPVVKAELRAQYEEECENQLMIEPEPTIIHKLNGIRTDNVVNGLQGQRDSLHTLDGESFTATPNPDGINNEGGEYPDLSHHQHLINQNGVQNSQQDTRSVHDSEISDTNGGAVGMPHGTKRSRSAEDDEEEDPYAHQLKRSRSASFKREEQRSPSDHEEGVGNLHSGYLARIQQPYLQHHGDAGHDDAQSNNGYKMDHGASGYNSSVEVQGRHGNILGGGRADFNTAEDVQGINEKFLDLEDEVYNSAENSQGMNGNTLHSEEADYDSAEDFQGTNGNLLHGEEADDDSAEDGQGMNGHLEEADYDSAEDLQGNSWYKVERQAIEPHSDNNDDDDDDDEEDEEDEEDEGEDEGEEEEEEEDEEEEEEEEYESDEEEQYSTAPQAAPHSHIGNGVITFSNTQDTAVVLSDSEDDEDKADDEDKTLVGYDGPTNLNDAKHYNVPAEESLLINA